MRKTLSLAVTSFLTASLVIVSACSGQTAKPSEAAKGEILVGVIEDMSGPVGGMGTPYVAGVSDCIRYLNEEQGGVLGHPLRAIIVDNKMDNALTVSGWDRMKREGVPFVMSCFASAAAVVLQQSCTKDRLPVLSGAGNIDLLFPKEPSYFFAVGPQLPGTIESMCKLVEKERMQKGEKNPPKMGADLISLGSQAQIMSKAMKISCEKRGWEYKITRTSPAPADVTTQVLQMKDFGCEYLYSMTTEAAAIAWFKELKRQNFKPTVFGASGLASEELWRATGELCAGSRSNIFSVTWYETDIPLVSKLHELNAKWRPEVTFQPSHYQKGFADMLVVTEALKRSIEKVGYEKLNGEAMFEAMQTMDYEPMGLGIHYRWTATDHQGIPGVRWYQRGDNGRLVSLGGWEIFDPLPEEQRTDAWWLK